MANEVKEQKEHVSENPVDVKDTERDASSADVVDTSTPPEATEVNEEITPHEKSVEKTDGTIEHLEKKEDDIDVTEVHIDLSKIKMDKDGIPEFTSADRDRIKASGIAFEGFENEIDDSRELIKFIRDELNEEKQKERETFAKEQMKNINARLEEIKCIENPHREEIDTEEKDLKFKLDFFKTEIENLPKNNPTIKHELEVREKEAIKHIAAYQNISRVDLGKLQNDGTISGLISSTANTSFIQAYVETKLDKKAIENDTELAKNEKKYAAIERNYELISAVKAAYDEFKSVKIDFVLKHEEDLKAKNEDSEIAKAIDYDGLRKVPELVSKITSGAPTEEDAKKYEEIRTSLIGVDENELESIKAARVLETEYLEEIEKYTKNGAILNQLTPLIVEKPIEKDDFIIIQKINKNSADKFIVKYGEIIEKEYERISNEYNELSDKVYKQREVYYKPIKSEIKRNGLFGSFVNYSLKKTTERGYYGRPESMLEFQHILNLADEYYNCIRENMNEETEVEYNRTKTNINSVSMNFNNIIRYFVDLYTDNIDLEWAANFDPKSVLKVFYLDNKEELDPYIKGYIETTKVFSHVLCHNIRFQNKYNKLISDACDYIDDNESKLKKVNDGKTIKNKYKFMTNIAFINQFTASYKRYIDSISEVNDAVTKKREENKEITFEEFDKWYKETQLAKELASTSTVISSFVHLILGCSVIYSFNEFKDYFMTKNNNKYLASDCFTYLFNEYILESMAFKNCSKDKTYVDYFKEKSRNIAFQSLDYTLQRDVDINRSRSELIITLFTYVTTHFRNIITTICSNDDATEKKSKEKKQKKNNVKSKDELMKSYREKAKEKKRNLGSFKQSVSEYKHLISDGLKTDNIVARTSDENNIYDISVYPSKDTKVLVRIDRYAKEIPENETKKVFEKAVTDTKLPVSVNKAYVAAKKVSIENLTNINEKWYYNQYVDGSLSNRTESGEKLSTIAFNELTLSERCRYILNKCIESSQDKIIEASIAIIKKTGIDFNGKTIAVKNNCKFDIKYFKANNNPSFYDGNLNFFKAGLWDIISFELNYDIVNDKK